MRHRLVFVMILAGAVLVAARVADGTAGRAEADDMRDDPTASARRLMVDEQIAGRGVMDPAVLDAMLRVPRHRFVPAEYAAAAYDDGPLPIGWGQTISQPYIVAIMTELLCLSPTDRVLEIGTGSGYQAAVLAEIAAEVYTIEIVPELGRLAHEVLADLGYRNIQLRIGDGYDGWPGAAPFDAVMLTAAPHRVPQPLLDQLAPGGRLVAPEGGALQQLALYTRNPDPDGPEFLRRTILGVRFVPMTGKARGR